MHHFRLFLRKDRKGNLFFIIELHCGIVGQLGVPGQFPYHWVFCVNISVRKKEKKKEKKRRKRKKEILVFVMPNGERRHLRTCFFRFSIKICIVTCVITICGGWCNIIFNICRMSGFGLNGGFCLICWFCLNIVVFGLSGILLGYFGIWASNSIQFNSIINYPCSSCSYLFLISLPLFLLLFLY